LQEPVREKSQFLPRRGLDGRFCAARGLNC
jgi:hypothetical protein